MSATDPAELLDIATGAARAAGELVRERRRGIVEVAATKSSATDVVTEADRASEELIQAYVLERRPGDAFLGEEGGSRPGAAGSGVRWVIDPIDGTVNFLYGLPQYAVSIAAEVDGEVVAGAVLDVAAGTLYTAVRTAAGITALKDGAALSVRAPAPLGQRLVATGLGYDRELRVVQARALAELAPLIRDIRRMGSCALDLCALAEGRLDGYVEEGVNLWDYAAAGLVAQGAGARVEAQEGATGRTLLIAAPAHGFQELRDAAVACGFAAQGRE